MEAERLKKIIDRENERAEEHAEGRAQELIRAIVREQMGITEHNKAIEAFRKELKALSVSTVDHSDVMGEY